MAEYYPLLSKAVGSLPNSTPDTRRVVYERARKALIGQLRTLHPPVPDEDIERESVELDKAIARIEDELAAPAAEPAPAPEAPPVGAPPPSPPTAAPPRVQIPRPAPRVGGGLGPPGSKPFTPLRTKMPVPKTTATAPATGEAPPPPVAPPVPAGPLPPASFEPVAPPPGATEPERVADGRSRLDAQRPIAPVPPTPKGPKRQMWIIWAGIGLVVLLVAGAAWKLRDNPQALLAKKPAEQPAKSDNGKIAERVGGAKAPEAAPPDATSAPTPPSAPNPDDKAAQTPATGAAAQPDAANANNPQVPVAQRAALLIEAPEETNKVKTFLGTVVWKINNVSDGPSDAVGTGVEATVDLPDDKLKAIIDFEKNTDSSLPASHTIKVRFQIAPGSASGDVKQISVPQLRKEDSPSGEPLAGVTVPVIQNSFLVGLSPGNAETANMELLRSLQWIDIPMLLTNGKIAKLTFEKGAAGERDLNDAITAWAKQ